VSEENGRIFRAAWIDGVHTYYPSEPKPGYVAPWEDTPVWEKEAATAVFEQVADLVRRSDGATAKLSRDQRGRFVALCWTTQIFKHFPDPKPSYVADWDDLPNWQQQTDADIFERIEHGTLAARES